MHISVRTLGASVAVLALLAGCSGSPNSTPPTGPGTTDPTAAGTTAPTGPGATEIGIPDADYTLEALIEAAKKEPPITVVDATGKIVAMAENFTAEYGVQATGVKMSATEQEEVLIREARARNVQTDVFNMSNLPNVTSQFIPEGYAISWLAPDLKEQIPAAFQTPAITSNNPWLWVYNSEVYSSCPIDNWWALTDEKWTGKVSIPDPMLRNETMFWFNQIEENADDQMAAAYQEYFGEALPSDATSAMAEWMKRFAQNKPNLQKSDSDVGPVVGAPGQTEPFMGFVSAAIFGDAEEDGFFLGRCDGLKPWLGQLTPRVAVIAAGTDSPNAAKLFARYMMTPEGMAPQMADGKMSTNSTAVMPADEPSGIFEVQDQLFVNNSATSPNDVARLQDWQDLWTVSSR